MGNRTSIRLPGRDYTRPGYYFITICTENRRHLFGSIINGKMVPNQFGQIVGDEWARTGILRENVMLDWFCVMPNHFHGIIQLHDLGTAASCRNHINNPDNFEQFGHPVHGSIPTIVRAFKSAVTKRIHELLGSDQPIWQRNYWEHIIRNHKELNHARLYIHDNTILWELDRLNGGVGIRLDLERSNP